jgi:type I restriction enzyme S subunit
MNRIDALIEDLCPEGIPRVRLGQITHESTERNTGAQIKHVRSVTSNSGLVDTETFWENSRTSSDTHSYKVLRHGTFAYNPSRINIGSIAWSQEQNPVVVSPMYVAFNLDKDLIIPEFLMHFFRSKDGKRQIEGSTESGARFRLPYENLSKIRMQLPPIQVQTEIVSILEKFTDLEAELEAELEARSKQFKYFCDYYFSENFASQNLIEIRPLGSQGTFQKGSGLQKNDFVESGVPCIHYGQIHTRFGSQTYEAISSITPQLASGLRKAKPGDIVIADTAEDYAGVAKATAWLGTEPIAVGGHTLIYSHQFDPIYLSYFLRSDAFQHQKNRFAKGVKVKDISSAAMAKIGVPVPQLSMQVQIGKTLLALDTLIIDSPASIKSEITARRQQYEHYRNKLLTFKELKAS